MDQLAPGPVERLPQIKVPTLILWGERDRLIPLRWGREFEKKFAAYGELKPQT